MTGPVTGSTFADVVEAEIAAINARRRHFMSDDVDPTSGTSPRGRSNEWEVRLRQRGAPDERGQAVTVPVSDHDLVGLSLSGGGVRSAAFCLGVLQGLDAAKDDGLPQVFDAVDYLSTVSGGGYIGTSLVAGYMQTQGVFPFASKLDSEETIETQHIRDYSNYLAPEGAVDWMVGVVALVRGLLINAMIFLGVILAAAFVTVVINPTETDLRKPHLDFTLGRVQTPFLWTILVLSVFLLVQVIYAALTTRPGLISPRTLRERESVGRLFVLLLACFGIVTFLEMQAFILTALFDSRRLTAGSGDHAGWLGHVFNRFGTSLPAVWGTLAAAATALAGFGGKLVAVARATLGDDSWSGSVKRWTSRILIYVAAVAVPLLLYLTYLAFCFWAIGWRDDPHAEPTFLHTAGWLRDLARHTFGVGHLAALYGISAAVLLVLSLGITPNASSLHGYYRDRLSRAFLWRRDQLRADAIRREEAPLTIRTLWQDLVSVIIRRHRGEIASDVDAFTLTSLKLPGDPDGPDPRAFAPFLIVNTAVNLEGSKYLNRRGRNADSFFFTPLFVGSEATGYVPTKRLEDLDRNMNLATAMAISGAAASANMGASTIRALTFSLAALNVRLGYWLPNPRLLAGWTAGIPWTANVGPYFFTLETFGRLNEWTQNVYLTDGGHFDNLGLYELLKRRCKVIIAADAEADPPMNFESLVRLQRYARIDLGILIDLPWEDLRRFSRAITVEKPHGPSDDPATCTGPHIALGRIRYGPDETGVLIYIKSCISGDESDLIRDYRRRNGDFPHETTLDQFFTEEQFEVYRALGFHATKSFVTGRDRFALLDPSPLYPDWPDTVRRALQRLNLTEEAIGMIVERQQDGRQPA